MGHLRRHWSEGQGSLFPQSFPGPSPVQDDRSTPCVSGLPSVRWSSGPPRCDGVVGPTNLETTVVGIMTTTRRLPGWGRCRWSEGRWLRGDGREGDSNDGDKGRVGSQCRGTGSDTQREHQGPYHLSSSECPLETRVADDDFDVSQRVCGWCGSVYPPGISGPYSPETRRRRTPRVRNLIPWGGGRSFLAPSVGPPRGPLVWHRVPGRR